jgi:DNA recombination protein RmuC
VLEKAQNQIIAASGNIEKLVGTRSRAIKRKLRNIQELPASEAARLLESNDADNDINELEEETDEKNDISENQIISDRS